MPRPSKRSANGEQRSDQFDLGLDISPPPLVSCTASAGASRSLQMPEVAHQSCAPDDLRGRPAAPAPSRQRPAVQAVKEATLREPGLWATPRGGRALRRLSGARGLAARRRGGGLGRHVLLDEIFWRHGEHGRVLMSSNRRTASHRSADVLGDEVCQPGVDGSLAGLCGRCARAGAWRLGELPTPLGQPAFGGCDAVCMVHQRCFERFAHHGRFGEPALVAAGLLACRAAARSSGIFSVRTFMLHPR